MQIVLELIIVFGIFTCLSFFDGVTRSFPISWSIERGTCFTDIPGLYHDKEEMKRESIPPSQSRCSRWSSLLLRKTTGSDPTDSRSKDTPWKKQGRAACFFSTVSLRLYAPPQIFLFFTWSRSQLTLWYLRSVISTKKKNHPLLHLILIYSCWSVWAGFCLFPPDFQLLLVTRRFRAE